MKVTNKAGSGLCSCSGSLDLCIILQRCKRGPAGKMNMEQVNILPLSVFVGHRYLQHGVRRGTILTD